MIVTLECINEIPYCYVASIKNLPDIKSTGRTAEEAIGVLVLNYQHLFEVEVYKDNLPYE